MSDLLVVDTKNREHTLRVLNAQLLTAHARVMQRHAEITSGAYKFRHVYRKENGVDRELTDDEKLESAYATLRRHVA